MTALGSLRTLGATIAAVAAFATSTSIASAHEVVVHGSPGPARIPRTDVGCYRLGQQLEVPTSGLNRVEVGPSRQYSNTWQYVHIGVEILRWNGQSWGVYRDAADVARVAVGTGSQGYDGWPVPSVTWTLPHGYYRAHYVLTWTDIVGNPLGHVVVINDQSYDYSGTANAYCTL
jgi:hypothetical protein